MCLLRFAKKYPLACIVAEEAGRLVSLATWTVGLTILAVGTMTRTMFTGE